MPIYHPIPFPSLSSIWIVDGRYFSLRKINSLWIPILVCIFETNISLENRRKMWLNEIMTFTDKSAWMGKKEIISMGKNVNQFFRTWITRRVQFLLQSRPSQWIRKRSSKMEWIEMKIHNGNVYEWNVVGVEM